MGRIKGIPVILINKLKTGEDRFFAPIYSEQRTTVENVLVSPMTSVEQADALNLFGKKAIYNIAIPKGDGHVWQDQKVEFFGRVWQVIGFPKEGIEQNIPLDWNQIWMVAAYE